MNDFNIYIILPSSLNSFHVLFPNPRSCIYYCYGYICIYTHIYICMYITCWVHLGFFVCTHVQSWPFGLGQSMCEFIPGRNWSKAVTMCNFLCSHWHDMHPLNTTYLQHQNRLIHWWTLLTGRRTYTLVCIGFQFPVSLVPYKGSLSHCQGHTRCPRDLYFLSHCAG